MYSGWFHFWLYPFLFAGKYFFKVKLLSVSNVPDVVLDTIESSLVMKVYLLEHRF